MDRLTPRHSTVAPPLDAAPARPLLVYAQPSGPGQSREMIDETSFGTAPVIAPFVGFAVTLCGERQLSPQRRINVLPGLSEPPSMMCRCCDADVVSDGRGACR